MSCSHAPSAAARAVAVWATVLFLAGALSAQQSPPASPQSSNNINLTRTPEDWASLSLAGSELHAQSPFLGERDRTDSFTREIWQVQWRNFDPIDLYIILPQH